MKTQRTTEEKREYYKTLRQRWSEAKKLSEQDNGKLRAIMMTHGLHNISPASFLFVKIQMEKLGLDGLPYIDMLTFNGWKENGYKVKKGEHSKVQGIAWLTVGKNEGEEEEEKENSYVMPKVYYLFHRSQVEAK